MTLDQEACIIGLMQDWKAGKTELTVVINYIKGLLDKEVMTMPEKKKRGRKKKVTKPQEDEKTTIGGGQPEHPDKGVSPESQQDEEANKYVDEHEEPPALDLRKYPPNMETHQ